MPTYLDLLLKFGPFSLQLCNVLFCLRRQTRFASPKLLLCCGESLCSLSRRSLAPGKLLSTHVSSLL